MSRWGNLARYCSWVHSCPREVGKSYAHWVEPLGHITRTRYLLYLLTKIVCRVFALTLPLPPVQNISLEMRVLIFADSKNLKNGRLSGLSGLHCLLFGLK